MSDKSFISILAGVPQLEQLNDDLREAELSREAPRLMVTESEYQVMKGGAYRDGGTVYDFADIRESHFAPPPEETLVDRSLGAFKLESGRLGFFVLLPPLAGVPCELSARPTVR